MTEELSLQEQEWARVREIQSQVDKKQKQVNNATTVEERDARQTELKVLCDQLGRPKGR